MENEPNKKDSHHPEDEDERSEADKDDEAADDMDRDDSDSGDMIDRWRAYVESVDTPAELAVAVQVGTQITSRGQNWQDFANVRNLVA